MDRGIINIIQFNYEAKQFYFHQGIAKWRHSHQIVKPQYAKILAEFTNKIDVNKTIEAYNNVQNNVRNIYKIRR